MSAHSPNPDRLHELLADQALHGLSAAESQELGMGEGLPDDLSFELAAAAADLALFPAGEQMPEHVRARLSAAADQFSAGKSNQTQSSSQPPSQSFSQAQPISPALKFPSASNPSPWAARLGWIAAAACLGIAALSWLPRQPGQSPTPTPNPTPDMAIARQQLLTAPDAVKGEWGDWASEGSPPEIAGVTGDVVFSPNTQSGFLRFVGLPDNPKDSQYQLWIVDERGMSQRVSGALFDAHSGGKELLVPITPRITVGKPIAFALTIEAPGGTWVSDMKRRVVIASPKS